MKQSGFVIAIAVLMLSACGNKSEKESTAVPASPPLVEHNTTVATDQSSMASPTKDKVSEMTLPTSTVATLTAPEKIGKLPKTNDGMKGELLSREEGLALANKSGCLVCHKIETKLVGPAWRDVSKRYKGELDAKARLIAKVKAGGKGNWTEITGGITMPPNSPRVSDENIEKLVTFILSQ